MNKFETHNLNKKEVKLYPQMREKYEKFYDSYSKRVWQDMDQNYIELKGEIQWCINRPKEIHVEIEFLYDRIKTINQCNHSLEMYIKDSLFDLSQESTSKRDRKIINHNLINFKLEKRLNKEEKNYLKSMIEALKQEKEIIQKHYHPTLKKLKEDLRQEKYQAFYEEVLNQLHISDILSSDIDSLKEQLKEKERINVNNI